MDSSSSTGVNIIAGITVGKNTIALFSVLSGSLIIAATIFLSLFWRNRDVQPIKGRIPGLVVLSQLALVSWMVMLAMARIFADKFPCWLSLYYQHLLLGMTADFFFLRLWILFFVFNMTREMFEQGKNFRNRSQDGSLTPSENSINGPSRSKNSRNRAGTDSAPVGNAAWRGEDLSGDLSKRDPVNGDSSRKRTLSGRKATLQTQQREEGLMDETIPEDEGHNSQNNNDYDENNYNNNNNNNNNNYSNGNLPPPPPLPPPIPSPLHTADTDAILIELESPNDTKGLGVSSSPVLSHQSNTESPRTNSSPVNLEKQRALTQHAWFIRKKYLVSNRSLFYIFLAMLIFQIITPSIVLGTNSSAGSHQIADQCELRSAIAISLAILVLLYAICFIAFAYKLRIVNDNFFIKQELKITGAITISTMILWGIISVTPSIDAYNKDHNVSTLILLAGGMLAFSVSTIYPLLKLRNINLQANSLVSSTNTSSTTSASAEITENFDKLLKYPPGLEKFREFLCLEFSVENLLFWEEVDDFMQRSKIKLNMDNFEENQTNSPFPVLKAVEIDEKQPVFDKKASHKGSLRRGVSGFLLRLRPVSTTGDDRPAVDRKASAATTQAETEAKRKQITLEIVADAVRLYSKYIKRGSPYEINIPHDCITGIYNCLKNTLSQEGAINALPDAKKKTLQNCGIVLPSDIDLTLILHEFNACQKIIYSLMKRDSFLRFCYSPLCKSLVSKMREIEQEQQEEQKALQTVDLL
jgi:hypothetical protein